MSHSSKLSNPKKSSGEPQLQSEAHVITWGLCLKYEVQAVLLSEPLACGVCANSIQLVSELFNIRGEKKTLIHFVPAMLLVRKSNYSFNSCFWYLILFSPNKFFNLNIFYSF